MQQQKTDWEVKALYISCASVCYRKLPGNEVAVMLNDLTTTDYKAIGIHSLMRTAEAIASFDREHLKALLDKQGIKQVIFRPPGCGAGSDDDVESQAQAIAKAVEVAEWFGSDTLSMGHNPSGAARTPGNIKRFYQCAERVIELTPHSQVRLAFENHPNVVLQFPDDYARLLAAIDHPRIGLCPDAGHFRAEGIAAADVVAAYPHRIYEVHIKDSIGRRSVGIGRGEVDFPALIDALHAIDFTGSLTVELEVEDAENSPRYVREAYAYLKGLLREKLVA